MDYQRAANYEVYNFVTFCVPLFAECDAELLTELVPALELIVCDRARVELIKAGSTGQGLFVVRRGECHCEIDIRQGKATTRKCVKVVKPGDHFGELSLLEPEKLTAAHVLAANKGDEVLRLTPTKFQELALTFPKLRMLIQSRIQGSSYKDFNFFLNMKLLKD